LNEALDATEYTGLETAMDISSISKYYELKPITVTPSQMLLDPTNPRIVLDVDTKRKFTIGELCSREVQEYILSVINKQAHHIADLIRGIRASGFIDKGDDMIVKRIPGTYQYLVIEGNRRTTAIKHLLKEPDQLNPVVRGTLTELHVKEFVYKENSNFQEETVIDILLGAIHVTGRLPWGALERAYYIYNSYLREMKKFTRNSDFKYLVDCSREVATFFNLSVRGVRKEIIVYRVYEQLKEQGYDVMPHHFSLINMAVTDRRLSEEYFELSPTSFRFSNSGLRRFDKLCVRAKKAINNPKDFRAFATLFSEGTPYEVTLVESNEQPVAAVLERLNGRREERQFLNHLEGIKSQLDALRPASFRGLKSEVEMIKKIKELVDDKLWRLAKN
jgi:hypothetical protein